MQSLRARIAMRDYGYASESLKARRSKCGALVEIVIRSADMATPILRPKAVEVRRNGIDVDHWMDGSKDERRFGGARGICG